MSPAPSSKENHKNFISVKDAAQHTGYSTSYISRLCRTKKMSCERENNVWFVNTQALEEYVDSKMKSKQARATTLARSRKDAYHYAQIEKNSAMLLSSENYMRVITPQPLWQKMAFAGVSLAVIFSSSSLVLFGGTHAFVHVANATLQESLHGFGEIATNATHALSQQIVAAAAIGNENYQKSTRASHLQTIPLAISMQDISTASRMVLPVTTTSIPLPSSAIIAKNSLKKLQIYDWKEQFAAAVANTTPISRTEILHDLIYGYVGSGQFIYSFIEKSLNGYNTLLTQSGTPALAFGATVRDALTGAPPTLWNGLKSATQFSLHSYVVALKTFVTSVPRVLYEGNKAVLTFGTTIFNNVGGATATATAYIP